MYFLDTKELRNIQGYKFKAGQFTPIEKYLNIYWEFLL